jgi:hypothetical protein
MQAEQHLTAKTLSIEKFEPLLDSHDFNLIIRTRWDSKYGFWRIRESAFLIAGRFGSNEQMNKGSASGWDESTPAGQDMMQEHQECQINGTRD